MIIAVLALGGAMIGATAIAGFLALYQLRATTDSVNSAKSVFAADSGTDFALFSYYCAALNPPRCSGAPQLQTPLADGASLAVTCYDASSTVLPTCYNDTSTSYVVSVGSSLSTERAFYVQINSATTTFP